MLRLNSLRLLIKIPLLAIKKQKFLWKQTFAIGGDSQGGYKEYHI